MSKKKWERPKLIVLVRGKPEEGVLLSCKGGGQGTVGNPVKAYLTCYRVGCDGPCDDISNS